MNDPIPARAVTGLLAEILAALDVGGAAHVVHALQRLTTGPAPAESDLIAETPSGPAAASTAPPAYDPANGPYATREQAEAAYADFTRGAGSGTLATRAQFLAESITDTVDNFAGTGAYDRQLAGRLAGLLTATDIGVIGSWIRRAAGDRPDDSVHIVNPDLELPESGQ